MTLSWMLWLCVGFLIGYCYHVLKVRDIQARRIRRMIQDCALDQVMADVAVKCAVIRGIERPINVRSN